MIIVAYVCLLSVSAKTHNKYAQRTFGGRGEGRSFPEKGMVVQCEMAVHQGDGKTAGKDIFQAFSVLTEKNGETYWAL